MVEARIVERAWDLLQRDRASIHPTPLLHWFAVGPRNRTGDYASSPGELVQAARTCQAMGMNFYLQLNPSSNRLRMRSRSEDVTHWMYLLLDSDPIHPMAEPWAALDAAIYEIQKKFGEVFPHVIDSGRGFQAWFPFHPIEVTRENREKIVAAHAWLLRELPENFGSVMDPAVADLPRVMRCPGTTNTKTGRVAKIIREFRGSTNRTLGIRVLEAAPRWEPRPVTQRAGQPWRTYIPHLTFGAMRFLSFGASKGARHNNAVKAVKSLFECGCEESQARAAVEWGSYLSEEQLGADEIDQIIRSVYQRSVL